MRSIHLLISFIFLLSIPSNAQCWRHIYGGDDMSAGIKEDGTLWTWGYNAYGQVGDGSINDRSTPFQIGTDTDWASVAIGQGFILAIKINGTLWACGDNSYGTFGDGTYNGKKAFKQVGSDGDWVKISAFDHIHAIKSDGSLWSWGQNNFGQLGIGSITTDKNVPTRVGTENNWKDVQAGYWFTLALKNDNTLWA